MLTSDILIQQVADVLIEVFGLDDVLRVDDSDSEAIAQRRARAGNQGSCSRRSCEHPAAGRRPIRALGWLAAPLLATHESLPVRLQRPSPSNPFPAASARSVISSQLADFRNDIDEVLIRQVG